MVTILIIEDEQSLLESVAELLALQGYEVLQANNGRKGIETAFQQQPDLIVCDIAMPEMDGYEVLRHLRASEQAADTPFIFLTARAERSHMRQGMELGADDYLTKPFTNDELVNAIDSRLQRHHTASVASEREVTELKKRLTHVISHELRTPLMSISSVQEMLSRQIDYMERDDVLSLLALMQSGSHRMTHLVEQMVLFTELETGSLNREVIAAGGRYTLLWDVIIAAINQGRQYAYHRKDGTVRLDERHVGTAVRSHLHSLRHAFAELISNALDYSPNGADVVVTHWVEGGMAWVTVADQGSGIKPGDVQRALQPFQQIGREFKEQQGVGLGLPLAARVFDVHGGTLEIRTAVNEGTTVIVSLPLTKYDPVRDDTSIPLRR
jgi:signal transduction histidine kinase